MSDKVLLAGPWQGEFGWELMRWNPHIRCMAKEFNKIIVAIQHGHEALYKDFATGFIYIPRGKHTDGWKNKNTEPKFSQSDIDGFSSLFGKDQLSIVEPNRLSCFETKQIEYKQFGAKSEKRFDILIHARCTTKTKSANRNWSIAKWVSVADHFRRLGYTIASVGVKTQAIRIAKTENLLDYPLSDLMNVMANSRLIVGPSSGPMHLATLCGCPQLVWTDKKKWMSLGFNTNRYRYEKLWNPFNVKTCILDRCNWQPQVNEVIQNIENILQ